jgi:hypothetical protein
VRLRLIQKRETWQENIGLGMADQENSARVEPLVSPGVNRQSLREKRESSQASLRMERCEGRKVITNQSLAAWAHRYPNAGSDASNFALIAPRMMLHHRANELTTTHAVVPSKTWSGAFARRSSLNRGLDHFQRKTSAVW